MIATQRKNTKTTQQIEVAIAIAVVKILPLPPLKPNVITDSLQNSNKLIVKIARV